MINLNEQKMIEDAVAEVEKTTSGEIKVVVVDKSSDYRSAHYRLGVMLALLTVFLPVAQNHGLRIFYFQISLFFLGYLLAFFPPIKSFFLSQKEKNEEVDQRAIQAFFENNLHTTVDRTGILIFVSLLERQVEIMADTGINEKVEKDTWQKTLDELILNIKKKNLIIGIQGSIFQCGEILAKHFPPKDKNLNELSDKPLFSKK